MADISASVVHRSHMKLNTLTWTEIPTSIVPTKNVGTQERRSPNPSTNGGKVCDCFPNFHITFK